MHDLNDFAHFGKQAVIDPIDARYVLRSLLTWYLGHEFDLSTWIINFNSKTTRKYQTHFSWLAICGYFPKSKILKLKIKINKNYKNI